jgi:hypothetical protein
MIVMMRKVAGAEPEVEVKVASPGATREVGAADDEIAEIGIQSVRAGTVEIEMFALGGTAEKDAVIVEIVTVDGGEIVGIEDEAGHALVHWIGEEAIELAQDLAATTEGIGAAQLFATWLVSKLRKPGSSKKSRNAKPKQRLTCKLNKRRGRKG